MVRKRKLTIPGIVHTHHVKDVSKGDRVFKVKIPGKYSIKVIESRSLLLSIKGLFGEGGEIKRAQTKRTA